MKYLQLTLLALCTFFALSAHAQSYKINVTLGTEQEMLNGLSAEYIASTGGLDMTGMDMSQFDKSTLYSMYCENPYVRAGLTWELPKQRVQFYAGLVGIFNRWDDITYSYEDPNGEYNFLNFSSLSHEIAVESVLEKRYTAWDILYFDAGLGANFGYSFGGYAQASYRTQEDVQLVNERTLGEIIEGSDVQMDQVVNFEQAYQYGDMKNGIHGRVFGKLGAGLIIFNRFELGAQVRLGVGVRKIYETTAVRTTIAGGDMTAAYRF